MLSRVMVERNGLGGAFSPSRILLIKFLGQPHTRGVGVTLWLKVQGRKILRLALKVGALGNLIGGEVAWQKEPGRDRQGAPDSL